MAGAGTIVASCFVAALAREGLTPDPSLRLLAWAATQNPDRERPLPDGPDELGRLHETSETEPDRVRRGAWYTPRWLADDLVDRAFAAASVEVSSVVDPSCGGGVFLLAAAERLSETVGVRAAVEALWGCDVDPVAVAVAEAALWWWSARAGEPTVAGGRLVVGDALVTGGVPQASVVVGNPPFLGQLRSATASDADRRDALRARFGERLRPYTDTAWLFLLAAVDATTPGGAVALVQPSSLLGARDAGPIRADLDGRTALVDVWIDGGGTFDAAVQACAPVLAVDRRSSGATPGAAVNDWTAPLASALGVPDVELDGPGRLSELAKVTAGFRDEYYGLVDAVTEGGAGPRLVSSGAIDPLRHRTDRVTRFAKRRWTDPRVDRTVPQGRAARWIEAQDGPKLIVATQTKVLEALVDPTGELVASVPAIVVRPHDLEDLWLLAAAIHAPACTAWMLRRSAGTALSNDACKPTAGLLAAMPLPVDRPAWLDAADLARAIVDGAEVWEAFAVAADAAYGVTDPAVTNWWLGRLPLR